MRVCDLNSGLGQLGQAYAKLKLRLTETREVWTDAAFEQFDKQRLNEIPNKLQRLTAAVNQLIEIVDRAERECGEPRDDL
jgi:hypothetical protein